MGLKKIEKKKISLLAFLAACCLVFAPTSASAQEEDPSGDLESAINGLGPIAVACTAIGVASISYRIGAKTVNRFLSRS